MPQGCAWLCCRFICTNIGPWPKRKRKWRLAPLPCTVYMCRPNYKNIFTLKLILKKYKIKLFFQAEEITNLKRQLNQIYVKHTGNTFCTSFSNGFINLKQINLVKSTSLPTLVIIVCQGRRKITIQKTLSNAIVKSNFH